MNKNIKPRKPKSIYKMEIDELIELNKDTKSKIVNKGDKRKMKNYINNGSDKYV